MTAEQINRREEASKQGFWHFVVSELKKPWLWFAVVFGVLSPSFKNGFVAPDWGHLWRVTILSAAFLLPIGLLACWYQWKSNERKLADNPPRFRIENGVVALAISLFFLLVGVSIWRARAIDIKGSYFVNSSSLLQARGTIVSSRLCREKEWVHPEIEYAFMAGNRTFRSQKVTFSCTGGGGSYKAEEYVQKYPAGKSVVVFYEPYNPSVSVLEPQTVDKFYEVFAFLILGLMGLVTSLAFIFYARSKS
jgi:hypothetical protein